MNGATILVQMADTKWTAAAVEAAAKQARERKGEVVLARMLSADCLNWLGMEAEDYHLSESECDDLQRYEDIGRRYGVPVRLIVRKYEHLEEELARAADSVGADEVIAHLPTSPLPFMHHAPEHHLDELLEERHHHLYTVEQPAAPVNWEPEAKPYHN